MKHRTHRVEDLIRAELSSLLLREVKDPRVRLATISSVQVSRDLRYATIAVSVLGSDEERAACIEALDHGKGFLRSRLAERLPTRTTPELRFQLDRGPEYSQRINDLLESLHDHDREPSS
jgi:ribosome-binding factor A